MVEVTPLESRIIKQVEYYFGDINMSRDKFMKEAVKENDGWLSMETLLKFKRLKSLSDDPEFIMKSVAKSSNALVEVGENGIRRNPKLMFPENLETALESCKDRSVYVKGFPNTATLDEIIGWLELYGGQTLNVHMRRRPHQNLFKGSVFAVFETKEGAERFLSDVSTFEGGTLIRCPLEDYWKRKKDEKESRRNAQAQKKADAALDSEKHLNSKMISGALLEISGLPRAQSDTESLAISDQSNEQVALVSKSSDPEDVIETKVPIVEANDVTVNKNAEPGVLTVLNLKHWLLERIGADPPVSWIDIEPTKGKAIVRFKTADTASKAWDKLKDVFGEDPVTYMNCNLTARVLDGEDERNHWRFILCAQHQKAQKRGSRHLKTNVRGQFRDFCSMDKKAASMGQCSGVRIDQLVATRGF